MYVFVCMCGYVCGGSTFFRRERQAVEAHRQAILPGTNRRPFKDHPGWRRDAIVRCNIDALSVRGWLAVSAAPLPSLFSSSSVQIGSTQIKPQTTNILTCQHQHHRPRPHHHHHLDQRARPTCRPYLHDTKGGMQESRQRHPRSQSRQTSLPLAAEPPDPHTRIAAAASTAVKSSCPSRL